VAVPVEWYSGSDGSGGSGGIVVLAVDVQLR